MKKALMGVFLAVLISTVVMVGSVMAQSASQIPVNTQPEPQTTITPPRDLPQTYGGSAVSYYMIPASEFFPFTNSGYNSDNFGRGPRWTTNGAVDMVAPVHLPGGAKVIYMELDYIDNSAAGRVLASLTVCPWTGSGCTYHPVSNPACQAGFICSTVGEASPNINVKAIDLTPDNLVVDTYNNQFIALVEPTTQDGLTKVAGLIIGYVLQVSPPPSVASFDDVPTSHPWFQWIEALKSSGITSGCSVSPPLFCPDQPVTRGQIAIFLSRGLGLQWH